MPALAFPTISPPSPHPPPPPSSCCCGGEILKCSSNKLFQPGARTIIAPAPITGVLSLHSIPHRKFQRPMTKHRACNQRSALALKKSTLGQKWQFDGTAKLLTREEKGLSYQLPSGMRDDDNCRGTGRNSAGEENDMEWQFEQLSRW